MKLVDLLSGTPTGCASCGAPLDFTIKGNGKSYCSDVCRHRGPRIACVECGAPAWSYPFDPKRSGRCHSCGQRASRLLWDRDTILEKIDEWVKLYGSPPVRLDWLPDRASPEQAERFRQGRWPHYSSVQREFGSMDKALAAYAQSPCK